MNGYKVLAHYLPQYYPIKENNEWFGPGFTEWTNVGKAKPLFKGHNQPRVPSDLGYYDLRLPEVRQQQADLAKQAGIDCFCYYHYWFGNGKVLLERPLQEVLKLKEPDFPFCLCWANHDWQRKTWDPKTSILNKEMLMNQLYLGKGDNEQHFKFLLPAFKDSRYYTIGGKLVFVIYSPEEFVGLSDFVEQWQQLAKENGLPGFYFIGYCYETKSLSKDVYKLMDGNALCLQHVPNTTKHSSILRTRINKVIAEILKKPLSVYEYKDVYKMFVDDAFRKDRVFPVILPNWDVTPRRGAGAYILNNAKPEYFQKLTEMVLDMIKEKDENDRIVFVKSWNEWGEGNYMEPDLTYGHGYIDALKTALTKHSL